MHNLNNLVVIFTLYLDIENVQNSLWNYYDQSNKIFKYEKMKNIGNT